MGEPLFTVTTGGLALGVLLATAALLIGHVLTELARDARRWFSPRLWRCSFCGTNQRQAHQLITGATAACICDGCVAGAQQLIRREQADDAAQASPSQ